MSRELRRVPPHWKHPIKSVVRGGRVVEVYDPLLGEFYSEAIRAWVDGYNAWESGEKNDHPEVKDYEDWAGAAPAKSRYFPFAKEEATWYQAYESVSEGTPISPPFPTREDLAAWLADGEDLVGQKWSEEAAKKLVYGDGYLPTAILVKGASHA